MPDEIAVELIEAVKRHRDRAAAFELRVPEFRVRRGGIVTICGTSGCGKTTFLDALACLSPFDKCSRFNIGRHDMARAFGGRRLRVRSRCIGYIQQQGGLIPFLTAGENIRLPLMVGGRSDVDPRRVVALAERLGVDGQLGKLPSALSVGQRQRVAIARALIHEPDVVLADEPTGALDPVNAREVCSLLVGAAMERGTAVVVVTHDRGLFSPVSDVTYGFNLNGTGNGVCSYMVQDTPGEGKEAGE